MNSITVNCLCIALLLSRGAFAQTGDHGKVWVQGQGITFSTTFNPTSNSQILDSTKSLYFSFGNSNICDSAGNLILVCDGYNLYDKDLTLIEDGDTLVPK